MKLILKIVAFIVIVITDTAKKIKEGKKVKVFKTEDKWYGMTYKEDTEMVKIAINDMVEKGLYK